MKAAEGFFILKDFLVWLVLEYWFLTPADSIDHLINLVWFNYLDYCTDPLIWKIHVFFSNELCRLQDLGLPEANL